MAELRELVWMDIPAAAEIEQRIFVEDPWSIETFWSELAGVPDRRRYLAATEGAVIAGYAGLALTPPDSDIQTVAVAPEFARSGIGEYLLTALLDHAREQGCTHCHLEVRSDNTAAIALYERHGFEVTSKRVKYYGETDALIMRAQL